VRISNTQHINANENEFLQSCPFPAEPNRMPVALIMIIYLFPEAYLAGTGKE